MEFDKMKIDFERFKLERDMNISRLNAKCDARRDSLMLSLNSEGSKSNRNSSPCKVIYDTEYEKEMRKYMFNSFNTEFNKKY